MRIIGNIFKVISLIFLLTSSGCGLVFTYGLVTDELLTTERASDGYKKGFDPLREDIKNCQKWKESERHRCIKWAWNTMSLMEGMFYGFAIGGNICLLILISWWYFRRRKKRRFEVN
jgi:hypothetical protein